MSTPERQLEYMLIEILLGLKYVYRVTQIDFTTRSTNNPSRAIEQIVEYKSNRGNDYGELEHFPRG